MVSDCFMNKLPLQFVSGSDKNISSFQTKQIGQIMNFSLNVSIDILQYIFIYYGCK